MIADNIQKLCKEHNITFAELERTVGIGNGVIARWNETRPRVDRLVKVAEYFHVTVDSLLKEE